jgi:glycine/D-amino acid oxidase-like deaminating enzyme
LTSDRRGAHVVVVGGGVVGRSVVRAAARAGIEATLVADGGPAASTVPVALLNPHRGRTGRAHADDVAALAVTWRWASELADEGFVHGAHRSGVLRIADGPKQARAFTASGLARSEAAGAGVRAPHGAFLVPDGGWLDPNAWLAALTGSAIAHGARCTYGAAVVAAEPRRGGGWRVHLADAAASDGAPRDAQERAAGDTAGAACARAPSAGSLDADLLVFATGAAVWPPALAAAFGPPPEVARVAGDVVVTRHPAPARPLAGATYVGPVATAGGPVAAIGGHHRSPGAPAADAADRLRDAARWTLPDLAAADADDRVWWGVRAKRPGGRPEVVVLAPRALWVGGLAGRGFLAAAWLAEAVAAHLVAAAPPAQPPGAGA